MAVDPVLRQLLRFLRSANDSPLRCGIDGPGLVAAVLERCSDDHVARLAAANGSPAASYSAAILHAIADEPGVIGELSGSVTASTGVAVDRRATRSGLAGWLEHFHATIGEIDRRGVEMILLRLEGVDDRQIAERLDMGLWLVRRILRDVRRALARDAGEGRPT